jgi:PAS domain S-box-containing protein
MPTLEEMSKQELLAALRALESNPSGQGARPESGALVHDLEVHQIELEMQNRQLRETEVQLEESARRYRDLYDFAPVVYFTLDLEGRIQEANLTAATFVGIERGALIGKQLISFVAASHRAQLRGHLHRCFSHRIALSVDLDLVLSERSIPVTATSVPVLDDAEQVVGCRTALTDISALKRTEQRLVLLASASQTLSASLDVETAIQEVLRSLVPSSADVASIDLVHRGEVRRFEARRESTEPMGVQITRSARPASSLGPDSPQNRVLESGKPILISRCDPSSLAGQDGLDHEPAVQRSGARSLVYIPLSSRSATLGVLTLISLDERRTFSGAELLFAADLASRVATAVDNGRLYREAKAAVRAREDILSFVAHDLRGLLFGSRLGIDNLLRLVPKEERRRGWKDLIRVQRLNSQMARMIEDLLDASSLDSGRLSLKLSDWATADLLSQVLEGLSAPAAAGGVAFAVDATDAAGTVCCDAGRVMQIFSNLVENAVKFTPKGGSITVFLSSAGEHFQFAVRDTGPGIAPEQLDHLFERYWQAEKNAQKGRGLGLYIAKHLVEAQGGRIWVESRLGAGTTFFFTLPRGSAGRPTLPASDRASDRASPSRSSPVPGPGEG